MPAIKRPTLSEAVASDFENRQFYSKSESTEAQPPQEAAKLKKSGRVSRAREKTLCVRVNQLEFAELQRYADATGLSVPAAIRVLALGAIRAKARNAF